MSRHDPVVSLREMLDFAEKALLYGAGKSEQDLINDEVLELALVRLLETLGEAASRIPPEEQAHHAHLPWRQMIGFRNVLAHGYDKLNMGIVVAAIATDLPPLVVQLHAILDS